MHKNSSDVFKIAENAFQKPVLHGVQPSTLVCIVYAFFVFRTLTENKHFQYSLGYDVCSLSTIQTASHNRDPFKQGDQLLPLLPSRNIISSVTAGK
jgi:hypothetical protein